MTGIACRGESGVRSVKNESALLSALTALVGQDNIQACTITRMKYLIMKTQVYQAGNISRATIDEQVHVFRNARIIIGRIA